MATRVTGIPYIRKRGFTLLDGVQATMWKNDQVLYKDHDAHFMVMERSRDRKTHEVHYPVKRVLPGGETDPGRNGNRPVGSVQRTERQEFSTVRNLRPSVLGRSYLALA